jgi:hypothetical protein
MPLPNFDSKGERMIQNDQELEVTQERIVYFQRLLAQLRVTARPEEFPAVASGYKAESMCLASKTRQAIAARVSASMASRKTRQRRRRGTLACRLCEPHRLIERPTTG